LEVSLNICAAFLSICMLSNGKHIKNENENKVT
jgi:hypothetical protein